MEALRLCALVSAAQGEASGGGGPAVLASPPASNPYSDEDFEFYAYHFKVDACPLRVPHDWAQCSFAHRQGGERSARRDLRRFPFLSIPCDYAKQRMSCPRGDNCPHAHSLYEYWLHPDRFRTEACQYGLNCKRPVCFFAHTPAQLRTPDPSLPPAELCWQTGASLRFGRNKNAAGGIGSPDAPRRSDQGRAATTPGGSARSPPSGGRPGPGRAPFQSGGSASSGGSGGGGALASPPASSPVIQLPLPPAAGGAASAGAPGHHVPLVLGAGSGVIDVAALSSGLAAGAASVASPGGGPAPPPGGAQFDLSPCDLPPAALAHASAIQAGMMQPSLMAQGLLPPMMLGPPGLPQGGAGGGGGSPSAAGLLAPQPQGFAGAQLAGAAPGGGWVLQGQQQWAQGGALMAGGGGGYPFMVPMTQPLAAAGGGLGGAQPHQLMYVLLPPMAGGGVGPQLAAFGAPSPGGDAAAAGLVQFYAADGGHGGPYDAHMPGGGGGHGAGSP
ncbi:MAG: hypothetical protein J3K34DRAFT_461082 [Monoraphidium minutum]|nr:MAG: hypothetical protein J3K34DRAFT_461082 [Monoraphidium minutum]